MQKLMISIIIPCYNGEKYIQRCLNSIFFQAYKNIEIIIVNDGSTDNSEEIILENQSKFEKEGFKYVYTKKKNGGLGSAINLGLKKVTGDYFTWCDIDNFFHKDYFVKHVNFLKKNKECRILRCDRYDILEDDINFAYEKEDFTKASASNTNIYDKKIFMNAILEKNFHFGCAIIKTTALDETIKDREIYESRLGQNWQLLLPVLYKYDAYYINEALFYYIYRSNSLSNEYYNSKDGRIYAMNNEHRNILIKTIKKIKIPKIEKDYLMKLIKQKYIIRNLEEAKLLNNKIEIDMFEKQYIKEVLYDNIYNVEIEKVLAKKPLISIIIPVYNGSNYMKEAIDSALSQTYNNIEIIVINDGSADNGETAKIAKAYGNKIKYFEKENGGVATALNYGISKMCGDYFSWLSHDDLYMPNKLEEQYNYLIQNNLLNKKVILYSNCYRIDEHGKIIGWTQYEETERVMESEIAILHGLLAGITMLIPKSAFFDCGLFDEKFRCVQDYLLFFDFMFKYKYVFMNQKLAMTRCHSQQVTNINPRMLEENNELWTKIIKNTPKKIRIKLFESEFNFYIDMYLYLTKYFNYKKAENYSINQAMKINSKKVEKFLNDNQSTKIIDEKIEINSTKNIFEKAETSSTKNIFEKFNSYIKKYGLINTLRAIKRKTIEKIKINKFTKPIYRIVKYIFKILFFIPKKIILLILNN